MDQFLTDHWLWCGWLAVISSISTVVAVCLTDALKLRRKGLYLFTGLLWVSVGAWDAVLWACAPKLGVPLILSLGHLCVGSLMILSHLEASRRESCCP
jgi:hypothetical protein